MEEYRRVGWRGKLYSIVASYTENFIVILEVFMLLFVTVLYMNVPDLENRTNENFVHESMQCISLIVDKYSFDLYKLSKNA